MSSTSRRLPARVLVADALPSMRRIVKNLLGELGYTLIDEAEDGSTALSMLQGGAFDLLITDWNMPEMTGIELLKAVRSHERLAPLPVLIVAAEANREQIEEAADAGVSAFIVKPFTVATLAAKLSRIRGSLADPA